MFRQSGNSAAPASRSGEVLTTSSGGGTGSDVNLTEVGGAAIALGQAAMAASLPVVLASDQTTVPVSGPLTDTQLRATPVPVSGTVTTGGLTDTQLRATPVPISGTVTANAGTNLDTSLLALEAGGNLAAIKAKTDNIPAQGQALAAGSVPVVLTAAQLTTLTPPAAITGFATEATLSTLNGKVTAVNTGAVVISAALPAGTNNIGDVDVLTLPALVAGSAVIGKVGIDQTTPGTTNLVALAANQSVNVAQINGVTPLMGAGNTGTGSPRVTIATDQAVIPVGGNIANDAADSGNPVKMGAVAYSPDGTTPGTAVTEGDRANAKCDLDGRLYVNDASPRSVSVHLDGSSAYTDQALFPDPGDGFQVVMTFLQVSTGAGTALNAFLEEGSTKVWGPIYLEAVAGRGYVSGPIHKEFTASTAVTLTTSAAIAQSIDATYFIQAV